MNEWVEKYTTAEGCHSIMGAIFGHSWSKQWAGGGDITWNCSRCHECLVDHDSDGKKQPPSPFAYQLWEWREGPPGLIHENGRVGYWVGRITT